MYKRPPKKTVNEQVKGHFLLMCLKCSSNNVVINYISEGGYSEETAWGSTVTIGCNDCGQNDLFLDADPY